MTEPARAETPVFTVGGLLAGLRSLLDERVGRVWVVGEVSNLHRAASGHVYFTLLDGAAQIRAALFRGTARRLAFEPEDGLEVLVYADVEIYEARGDLQLIVRQLEPRGDGALRLAFEQLRRRLEAEGLFDPARKRELPPLPRRIGVVTSPRSAAIRDVLQVAGRRFPALPVRIAATPVQGAGAEAEIAAALDALGRFGEVDVILLVRGGGALEDLQAFNTEVVARAVAGAPVPVVAGVGHEVDVTIADLVADCRAATPSAAAELAVPDADALRRVLARDWRRLLRATRAVTERASARIALGREGVVRLSPVVRLAGRRERLAALSRALPRLAAGALLARRARLAAPAPRLVVAGRAAASGRRAALAEAVARLESLSPLAVLSRGYALVRRARDGEIVRRAEQLAPGERLAVRVAEAELEATSVSVRPLGS